MKYIVKLEFFKFAFDDMISAGKFAEIAKQNFIKDKEDDIEVTIYLKEEKNKEE